MDIKEPVLASAGLKALRGLSGDAYSARLDTFSVLIIPELGGVPLKAGEETPVVVDVPNLPPNANIHNITATLTATFGAVDGTSPGPATAAVSLTDGAAAPRKIGLSVNGTAGKHSIQVRLNQGSVFWSQPAAIDSRSYTIPDFSPQVNTYLDKLQPAGGKVTLQFLVKSDADGHFQIAIGSDLSYSLLKTQSWTNALDATHRVDRTLNLTFNQIETLPIDPVSTPAGVSARISAIRLDAGGQFGPDRLLGAVEVHDGREFATVSPDFSLAQSVTPVKALLQKPIQCTGIAGYFQADDKAEFYLELQGDQTGFPASGAPLAKSSVAFVPADPNDPQPWTFAKFEKPAELKPDTPYWIVAKGVRGVARSGLTIGGAGATGPVPVARGALLLNRGGQIWKNFAGPPSPPLQALLSLVYVPQPDNQTAAVEISVDGGTGQRFDPQTVARTISFDGGNGSPQLVIDSRALGSLTIANVIQEYTLS